MARICVVRQHYFPQDTRVAREVAALAAQGHLVDVFCLRKPGEPARESDGVVTVRRLPLPHTRAGAARYLLEYSAFFLMAACAVTASHLRRSYRLIQIHSLPDVLVFCALVPRLVGAPVLLDLQECMPEFLGTKFGIGCRHPAVRLTGWLEQLSIRFASRVITPTTQMRETFVARGADAEKITVVMDGADEEVFQPVVPAVRHGDDQAFTLICHGTVEEQYGLDTVVRAVALLRHDLPELRFEIYGDGSFLGPLRGLVAELDIEDRVYFSGGFVPLDELVGAIAHADAGVVAMKRDPFRDVTIAGKMFDFIAMRKPVIVSRTRAVEETFGDDCVEYFRSDDPQDLARAIKAVSADEHRRRQMAERAAAVAEPFRWPHQRDIYLDVTRTLLDRAHP